MTEDSEDPKKFIYLIFSESHSVVSNSLRLHGLDSPCNSLGQNSGVGRLSLLQGIFPTLFSRGSSQPRDCPGLPNCRRTFYQLNHKGSPFSILLNFLKIKIERLLTPVFWPREFHGRYSPWGHKESDRLSNFHFHFIVDLQCCLRFGCIAK